MTDANKPQNHTDWTGITKWLVIGAVIIVTLLILKKPIGDLINRAEEVEVDTGGKISIKTAKTPIGDLKVSSEKVNETQARQITARQEGVGQVITHNYMLTWPRDTWMRDDAAVQQLQQYFNSMGGYNLQVELVCRARQPNAQQFSNNVYVATAPYDDRMSFTDQVNNTKLMMQQQLNARFVTEEVDPKTMGATFIYTYEFSGMPLYQIQRIAIKDGRIYQVVASTTVADRAAQAEISRIINSFRIIE